MKIRLSLFLLCFSFGILAAQHSNQPDLPADTLKTQKERLNPWQQASGEFLFSPFLSHYRATSFRDANGNKSDFADNGRYTNYNPRLYVAAPLISDKLNVIASIPYFFNRYENLNSSDYNTDFGDIELGLRMHLAKMGDNYLMGSLISYIPAYSNTTQPVAGYDLFGLETRLALVGSLKFLGDYNNFHKVELGLRYFFPNDPTQLRFLLSEGFRVTNQLILMGEFEGLFSYSKNDEFFTNNLQNTEEYKIIKATFNMGYEFTPEFALYAGAFHDVYNRNAAIGHGFQVFSVIKLN